MVDALLPPGRLEPKRDAATYFLAQTGLMGGRRFRVYDVRIVAGRTRRATIPLQSATHRIFVQADSGRWSYGFAPGEGRELEISALERQLRAATYHMPDPSKTREPMGNCSSFR
jgi:hypothetical protein